jgi:mannose-6-phosphate isomerase-like protein (cupin superfamily)
MDAKKLATLRMIEGGKYNVNIRRITNAETALVHPKTVDLWVVIEGSGTLTTGGKIENGKIVGGSSHPIKVGDVEFIPAGIPHGVSGVDGNITWLNIRWDIDYPAK